MILNIKKGQAKGPKYGKRGIKQVVVDKSAIVGNMAVRKIII
jgi:hypothetical protein